MTTKFGDQLTSYRKRAKLTQIELAKQIGRPDGTVISRLETGAALPDIKVTQVLVSVLTTTAGLQQEEIDSFWEAGGYHSSDIFANRSAVADSIIVTANQTLEKLDTNKLEREMFVRWIQNGISFTHELVHVRRLMQQGDWGKAGKELEKGRAKIDASFQYLNLQTHELNGDCKYHLYEFDEAIDYYHSALFSTHDQSTKARIYVKLGDAHRRLGGDDWEIAINRYTDAEKIFHDLGQDAFVAKCKRKSAGTRLYQGLPDEARPLLADSYAICRRMKLTGEIKKIDQHMAWVYFYYGRWEEAVELCRGALRDVDDSKELIKGKRYLGDALRLARKLDEAKTTYQDAIALSIQGGLGLEIEIALIRLGLAKLNMKGRGKEPEARELLDQALAVVGKRSDFKSAEVLKEVGNLYLKLRRPELAENYLRQSVERFQKLHNVFHYSNTLSLQCELFFENGDLESLLETAKIASNLPDSERNYYLNYPLARIDFFVGKAGIEQNNYPETIKAWHRAIKQALSFNLITFNELVEDIVYEIDRVAKEISPKIALTLCEQLAPILVKAGKAFNQKEACEKASNSIQQLREQLTSLLPVKSVSKAGNNDLA